MSIRTRLGLAMVAMVTSIWISATSVRHWVPNHGRGITWLLIAPVLGCAIAAIGLAMEEYQVHRRGGRQIVHWGDVYEVALWFEIFGLGLMSYRALWMFFSWDGMFYFAAWLLLAAAVLCRWRPRWIPCS
ncbi:MAG: hypothetical protein ACRD04_04810 [Terriglobales bacterium]